MFIPTIFITSSKKEDKKEKIVAKTATPATPAAKVEKTKTPESKEAKKDESTDSSSVGKSENSDSKGPNLGKLQELMIKIYMFIIGNNGDKDFQFNRKEVSFVINGKKILIPLPEDFVLEGSAELNDTQKKKQQENFGLVLMKIMDRVASFVEKDEMLRDSVIKSPAAGNSLDSLVMHIMNKILVNGKLTKANEAEYAKFPGLFLIKVEPVKQNEKQKVPASVFISPFTLDVDFFDNASLEADPFYKFVVYNILLMYLPAYMKGIARTTKGLLELPETLGTTIVDNGMKVTIPNTCEKVPQRFFAVILALKKMYEIFGHVVNSMEHIEGIDNVEHFKERMKKEYLNILVRQSMILQNEIDINYSTNSANATAGTPDSTD